MRLDSLMFTFDGLGNFAEGGEMSLGIVLAELTVGNHRKALLEQTGERQKMIIHEFTSVLDSRFIPALRKIHTTISSGGFFLKIAARKQIKKKSC